MGLDSHDPIIIVIIPLQYLVCLKSIAQNGLFPASSQFYFPLLMLSNPLFSSMERGGNSCLGVGIIHLGLTELCKIGN